MGKISKVNGERHEYIFNSENRMTGYRKYDLIGTLVATADYFYDPVGRRMAKSVGGVLTRYIYNEEDVWMQLAADGNVERMYGHGPGIDEPLWTWRYDGEIPYYYMPDAIGTIRDIRNYAWYGDPIVASFTYDSFGQITSSSSTLPGVPDIYRYTARELDPESNLYFLRARYYDAHSGRFTSEDPVPDLNLYPYALNNPLNFTDPSGRKGERDCEKCDEEEVSWEIDRFIFQYHKWRSGKNYCWGPVESLKWLKTGDPTSTNNCSNMVADVVPYLNRTVPAKCCEAEATEASIIPHHTWVEVWCRIGDGKEFLAISFDPWWENPEPDHRGTHE